VIWFLSAIIDVEDFVLVDRCRSSLLYPELAISFAIGFDFF